MLAGHMSELAMCLDTDPFPVILDGLLTLMMRVVLVQANDADMVSSSPLLSLLSMSILYWNSCGMGNAGTINHLRFLKRTCHFNLLFIAKPKINGDAALRA